MYSFNYQKLKGKIKEVCSTQETFASRLGMNATRLSLKLNNQSEWRQSEILKACNVLSIADCEIKQYFFTPKV